MPKNAPARALFEKYRNKVRRMEGTGNGSAPFKRGKKGQKRALRRVLPSPRALKKGVKRDLYPENEKYLEKNQIKDLE